MIKKGENTFDYYWYYLGKHGDKVIFYKAHFQELDKSKKSAFVGEMVEVDAQGAITSKRSMSFEPKTVSDDREFFMPRIIYDESDASIYFMGYMEIDKSKVNGLYLLKYGYESGALIYSKEYTFKDLMKPDIKKSMGVHYMIPEKVSQYYPLRLRYEDVLIDDVNHFLNLRIITDFGFNSTSFFEVTFDEKGDHIKTGLTHYPAFINAYGLYLVTPEEYQLVWSDKAKVGSRQSPWDFVNAHAEKKSDLYWVPMSSPKANWVLIYNSETRAFSGVSLK